MIVLFLLINFLRPVRDGILTIIFAAAPLKIIAGLAATHCLEIAPDLLLEASHRMVRAVEPMAIIAGQATAAARKIGGMWREETMFI